VAGNNIANANDPSHPPEALVDPFFRSSSTVDFGGVTATGVRQQIDEFLQRRIYVANGTSAATPPAHSISGSKLPCRPWATAYASSQLGNLMDAFNNLLNQPELTPAASSPCSRGPVCPGRADLRRHPHLRTTVACKSPAWSMRPTI
jgi:hypothetical protein